MQVHSRYDPTAHAGELREEGATAKGIPQGFTKKATYGEPGAANASQMKLGEV